jgi:hypothetical protein
MAASRANHGFQRTMANAGGEKSARLEDVEPTKERSSFSSTGCVQHVDKEHLAIGTARTKAPWAESQ